jgi:hypothetical protein
MAYLRYPYEALTDSTDYLRVDIVKYSRPRVTEGPDAGKPSLIRTGAAFNKGVLQSKKAKDLNYSIILPIPSNIQDGNSVSYADSSLDGLTAGVATLALDTINGSTGDLSNIGKNITDFLKSATKVTLDNPDALKMWVRNIAAQAANIPFGGNLTANQLLARESGEILNPNMELLFNGVNLRTFKFSFKMTPRNTTESDQIRQIIRSFKKSMAPRANGNFLETPFLFELSYRKGDKIHPYLNLFKQCFLTDMNVNYTGEGVYATYSDGSPISYVMDLGFKEIEPIYYDNYADTLIPTSEETVGF